MKQLVKHIRQAIKEAGVKPDSISFTARGHYCVVIGGCKVMMAGSPSDNRAMKNAVATMRKAARNEQALNNNNSKESVGRKRATHTN